MYSSCFFLLLLLIIFIPLSHRQQSTIFSKQIFIMFSSGIFYFYPSEIFYLCWYSAINFYKCSIFNFLSEALMLYKWSYADFIVTQFKVKVPKFLFVLISIYSINQWNKLLKINKLISGYPRTFQGTEEM